MPYAGPPTITCTVRNEYRAGASLLLWALHIAEVKPGLAHRMGTWTPTHPSSTPGTRGCVQGGGRRNAHAHRPPARDLEKRPQPARAARARMKCGPCGWRSGPKPKPSRTSAPGGCGPSSSAAVRRGKCTETRRRPSGEGAGGSEGNCPGTLAPGGQ